MREDLEGMPGEPVEWYLGRDGQQGRSLMLKDEIE
jgi:hypothetical protein